MNGDFSPEVLAALDMLHHASVYLDTEFRMNMKRGEAKANLEARAIIFNCCNAIFREHGCGISREEVEGARIIERSIQ